MTTFAYARVSTSEQTVAPQVEALLAAGVDKAHIHTDAAVSGMVKGRDRAGLAALLIRLQPGDTLIVVRLDRLGRSVIDVLTQVEALTARGIVVRSLSEGIDSSTPAGRMVIGVMASLAAYERELTRERQTAGIASAKAAGKHLGRPHSLTLAQREYAVASGRSAREVSQILGCSESTARRALRAG